MQTTILSRFDLIFIVKDERSMDRDRMIAQHVLNVHKNASAALDTEEEDRKVCLTSHSCIVMEMHKAVYSQTVMDTRHIRTAYSVCWHSGLAEVLMDKMLVMRDLQLDPCSASHVNTASCLCCCTGTKMLCQQCYCIGNVTFTHCL